MVRGVGWVGCAVLVGLLAGCADGKATVSGTVSFNGEPVARGSISLLPADGKGSASGATIENGRYVVRDATPGEKIVQISAPYSLGVRKDDYGNDAEQYGDLLPASWGRASREKVTVAAPKTEKDFAIEGPDPRNPDPRKKK